MTATRIRLPRSTDPAAPATDLLDLTDTEAAAREHAPTSQPGRARVVPPPGPLRVLVVDDHLVVREGTALLLRQDPTLSLAGYARTAAGAMSEVRRLRPAVVLLDQRLPDALATDVLPGLLAAVPTARVLIFTAYADRSTLDAALAAGAHGCLLKDVDAADLTEAICRVAAGETVIDPRIAGEGHDRGRDTGELTGREFDVLTRVALGETNPEIAVVLDISRNTVKSYLQVAMQKLGARNRVELLLRAREAGLL